MTYVNENHLKLHANHLFAEAARRVEAFSAKNPEAKLLRLEGDDVTLPLAPAVCDAMHRAVDEMGRSETFRGYPPCEGYDFLREAIVRHDYKARGLDISADEVFISDGAKSDCANIQELFDPGERIAVTDPACPVYVDSNVMAGRAGTSGEDGWSNVAYLPMTAENGFCPDLPKGRAGLLYLCLPNNPTGAVLTKDQLSPFVEYALQNKSVILFDAAYEAYVRDPALPRSIYEIDGARECAIELRSFSKTAGFTGIRCAYAVVPREVCVDTRDYECVSLNKLWLRRQAAKYNGVSYVVQRGAEAVYSPEGRLQVAEQVAYYMRNAAMIRQELEKLGFSAYGGENAPYVWVRTPKRMDSWAFFDLLLKEAHMVGMPGSAFGPSGEGYFRLAGARTAGLDQSENSFASSAF